MDEMAEDCRLLFFSGSIREDSYNKKLARLAYETARERGHAAEFIDLKAYPLPLYNGDLETSEGPPENGRRLKELFWRHQGIFIASPEYNASISPLLKNTLDWISRRYDGEERPLQVYQTRVFAISSASPGGYGGMRGLITLRQSLALGMGALVLAEQVAVAQADKAFDATGRMKEERLFKMLTNAVDKLADAARRFKA